MNELIFVIEKRTGLCEHNFVSTFDELARQYMRHEDLQTIDNIRACVEGSRGQKDVWNMFYLSYNVSFDIRACVDRADLKDFLSGKFNDSLDNLDSRLPGSNYLDGWYWDNDVERFSQKAVDIMRRECPEQFASIGLKHHGTGAKTSLADVIKKATFIQNNTSHVKSREHLPEYYNHKQI